MWSAWRRPDAIYLAPGTLLRESAVALKRPASVECEPGAEVATLERMVRESQGSRFAVYLGAQWVSLFALGRIEGIRSQAERDRAAAGILRIDPREHVVVTTELSASSPWIAHAVAQQVHGEMSTLQALRPRQISRVRSLAAAFLSNASRLKRGSYMLGFLERSTMTWIAVRDNVLMEAGSANDVELGGGHFRRLHEWQRDAAFPMWTSNCFASVRKVSLPRAKAPCRRLGKLPLQAWSRTLPRHESRFGAGCSGPRQHRRSALAEVGLVVFGVGLATWSVTNERLSLANERLEIARIALREAQANRAKSSDSGIDGEALRREAARRYVETFPWEELFSALEAVADARVVSFAAEADEGIVRLELLARDEPSAASATAGLAASLSGWDLRTLKQSQQEGGVAVRLELADRLRPK